MMARSGHHLADDGKIHPRVGMDTLGQEEKVE
jgi:hypothetical protein